uniref:Palmitoyltransferase n=1 Tax=Eptatretus burgeri TaxID=7764 RepID=A0A8C4QY86_EPTBU
MSIPSILVLTLNLFYLCSRVNNCVGFSNYKFFVLFLAYALIYCVYIAATVLQYFLMFWKNTLENTRAKFHILFLFFAAVIFGISVISLFGYHCWLISKNRSTLEAFRAPIFRNGPDKNGFNLGFKKNVQQVFGDQWKYWFLPVFSSLSDGCSFPTCLVSQDVETGTTIGTPSPANSENGPSFSSRSHDSQSYLLSVDQLRSGGNTTGVKKASVAFENESS